jgi:hypothetical protein
MLERSGFIHGIQVCSIHCRKRHSLNTKNSHLVSNMLGWFVKTSKKRKILLQNIRPAVWAKTFFNHLKKEESQKGKLIVSGTSRKLYKLVLQHGRLYNNVHTTAVLTLPVQAYLAIHSVSTRALLKT